MRSRHITTALWQLGTYNLLGQPDKVLGDMSRGQFMIQKPKLKPLSILNKLPDSALKTARPLNSKGEEK